MGAHVTNGRKSQSRSRRLPIAVTVRSKIPGAYTTVVPVIPRRRPLGLTSSRLRMVTLSGAWHRAVAGHVPAGCGQTRRLVASHGRNVGQPLLLGCPASGHGAKASREWTRKCSCSLMRPASRSNQAAGCVHQRGPGRSVIHCCSSGEALGTQQPLGSSRVSSSSEGATRMGPGTQSQKSPVETSSVARPKAQPLCGGLPAGDGLPLRRGCWILRQPEIRHRPVCRAV